MPECSLQPSSLVALLSPVSSSPLSLPELYTLFSSLFLPHLATSRVFPRLANLQASLDPLDIEGLLQLLYSSSPLVALKDIPQPTLPEFATFVQTTYPSSNSQPWSQRDHVIAFLLSAAFKDCSLIFRVPIPRGEAGLESEEKASVKVIDLDPKPVDRLEKWAKLDADIVSYFGGLIKQEEKAGRPVRKCCERGEGGTMKTLRKRVTERVESMLV